MNNIFDVGIVGAGVAGAFACLKLTKEYSKCKTIVFDIGRPPAKRRSQINGWLGCLPNSDGKLFLNNITKVSELVGVRKAKTTNTYFNKIISEVNDFVITKDKSPSVSTKKKIVNLGYEISLNDHIQIYPKDIHLLSKIIANVVESNDNINFSFDNEVQSIRKHKNVFIINTEDQEYKCKKLLISVGRSGWRWATNLYSSFGMITNNDIAKYGIRIEMDADHMKDFNKSCCTIKNDELEIGPLSWNGTIIPEDHVDLAISAFRSNENRWKSDKVSFSIIGDRKFPEKGFEQTDRLGKLTFVITNDRIIKEKVNQILTGKSKISIIPEYEWLKNSIIELSGIIPEIINKAYYHAPTIFPMIPNININKDLSTDVDGLFVAGESAGVHGILSACLTGTIAAESICNSYS